MDQKIFERVLYIIACDQPCMPIKIIHKLVQLNYFNDNTSAAEFLDELIRMNFIHYSNKKLLSPTMRGLDNISIDTYGMIMEKINDIRSRKKQHDSEVMRIVRYTNRQEHYDFYNKLSNGGRKLICPTCLLVNVPCSCPEQKVTLPFTAKIPRKNASKRKWNQFIEKFNIRSRGTD